MVFGPGLAPEQRETEERLAHELLALDPRLSPAAAHYGAERFVKAGFFEVPYALSLRAMGAVLGYKTAPHQALRHLPPEISREIRNIHGHSSRSDNGKLKSVGQYFRAQEFPAIFQWMLDRGYRNLAGEILSEGGLNDASQSGDGKPVSV